MADDYGFDVEDLHKRKPSPPRGKPEATYVYKDASGTPLYDVVRFAGKQFRQRAHGDKAWGIPKGTPWVLFRLPQVLAAAEAGQVIYVVDGEKDVLSIVKAGGVATCNPGGCGKWREEYADAFVGAKRVVIVADRDDDPAHPSHLKGYKHARDVEASLRRRNVTTDVRRALAGKDVTDHLAAGYDLPDLEPVNLEVLLGPTRLPRITATELAAELPPLRWVVRGLIAEGTFGPLAGEMKTLKTYTATGIALGVAAGLPVLDHWEVPKARPVVVYVGEGGEVPYRRRLQRFAAAYGVPVEDLLLSCHFAVAPLDSEMFRLTLQDDLDELQPGLVILDPLYAFHSPDRDAKNLYDRGPMLRRLSEPIVAGGASLVVVDHFNQTGSGSGLRRISQAGTGEWADSWWLQTHRRPADVAAGQFWIGLEVGSRQWGGNTYDADWDIGAFDMDAGDHTGAVTCTVNPADLPGSSSGPTRAERRIGDEILRILDDHPFEYTRTKVIGELGGNAARNREVFDALEADGAIYGTKTPLKEGTRVVARLRYGRRVRVSARATPSHLGTELPNPDRAGDGVGSELLGGDR